MNNTGLSIGAFDSLPLSPSMIADLRSDHAGEAGAVQVYRGMLAVSRKLSLRRFALAHVRAELRHLRFFEQWLPARFRSRLLPVWRRAGWLLGASAALFGCRTAFLTVAAIESFVERHYLAQIEAMNGTEDLDDLRQVLLGFCADEVHHRNDARNRLPTTNGCFARLWASLIGLGSALGVCIARKV